jgi:drug/metabolite transporter (DMT)-like permease
MSSAEQRRQNEALAAALAIIVVWGVNFSVQKYLFSTMSPGGFLFARYLLMPACALALLLRTGGGRLPALSREDFWALARLGFIGHVVHVGMVTYGIHWSTAFSSSLILACGPVFTLLILRWQGVETLTRMQVVGVAVALAGVLVFLSEKLLAGRWQATGGDLFLLLASSFFSYYTVATKPLIVRLGSIPVMAWATLLASAPLVLMSAPAALRVHWDALAWTVWAAMLWATLVSAFLGWLLWGWVNAVRGVARSAPLMYLMPPVAGVVAWLTTDERFTATKLLGAAITLGGVALAQFASPPGRPEREAPGLVD